MTNQEITDKINRLKKEKNAIILAHYYTRPEVQDAADYLGDSLGLSQWSVVLESVLLKDGGVAAAMRSLPGFTGKGLQMGLDAAKSSLAAFGDSRLGYMNAKTDLQRSLDKIGRAHV